ncbi:hypothetical protein NODU109028_00885 [Nocardioides dubius]|uniref:DUF485 domain-containing protein n=1 Tax=Nocardioides dubius TaxID=317019 RepID=A0ABP4EL97_9ACTN
MNDVPERVRVTGPPRRPTRARARTREIDDETALGSVLMGSLMSSQLRLAGWVLAPVIAFMAGVPLVFHLWPQVAEQEVLRVPVAWMLLGFAIYPLLIVLGWLYVRRAEANERDFAELLDVAEGP